MTQPPSLSLLKQSASTWREGNELAQVSAAAQAAGRDDLLIRPRSRLATVTFTFTQRAAGRMASGKCVAQTNHNKHKPRCSLIRVAGMLHLSAHRGTNHVVFQGRISRTHRLKPGRYSLVVIATARGMTSPRSTLNFTIVTR